MSYENECEDCGKPISDEYERCYECNEEHNATDLRFKIAETRAETDKAVLVTLEKAKECSDEIWLPKSTVTIDESYVYVPVWLAEKKEIDGLAV